MSDTYYPIPDDVANDHSCKSYTHFHFGNESPLASDYAHYVRKPDPRDSDGLFHGEWENVTEADRRAATVENKQKQLEQLEKEKRKIEAELKALAKEEKHD